MPNGTPPPVLIGAGGLVGTRLRNAWRDAGVAHLAAGRGGGMDLLWDMGAAPPPCPAARGAGVIVLAGVTPLGTGAPEDNTRLAEAGIAAARGWGAAHVFVTSSSGVYGETTRAPVDEDAELRPASAYARAKLAMERATAARDVTALRLANVAGASQPFLAIAKGGVARLDAFADAPDAPMRSFIGPVALARCLAALGVAAAMGRDLPPVLNVAACEPVAMADIFAARGIVPERPAAPARGIRYVNLDTSRLGHFWDVPAQGADALWSDVAATEAEA